ncbi:MAG: tetratricopeptide repeat protein [Lysobacterales bacterium]
MFWIIAALILFIGFVIALLPLLRDKSGWQPLALALVFALPAAGLWMYNQFATPAGLDVVGTPNVASAADPHSGQAADMQSMIAGLQQRLEQNPDDLEGWLLLARTLRASQRFEEASQALERAFELAPDNLVVMVDLAESRVYLDPEGRVPESSVQLLERALETNPDMQKALWLMGIAAVQQGDDAFAISYWQSLMSQLEPGTEVYEMVGGQLAQAQARLGMLPGEAASAPPEETESGWTGTRLVLDAAEGARQALANGAILYITIRAPGPAMGPPLGVRRIEKPEFPLELTITDQDSMMAERMISSESAIQVQARVSLTGAPTPQPGDWRSALKSTELASSSLVVLEIDQQVE